MSVVRNVSRSVFFTSLLYIENDQRNIEYRIFYLSPVSPKGRVAVCLLAEKVD